MTSSSLLLLALSLPLAPINRQEVVERHKVTLTQFNPGRAVQIGNGEFAFNADLTGLQTFSPFNTLSQWGWLSSPLPTGTKLEDFSWPTLPTHGMQVPYRLPDPKNPALSSWMSSNPHRINLGRVGLILKKKDGSRVAPSDLTKTVQTLDLWSGVVTSRFLLEGVPVTVKTACHPSKDSIGVEITSPLVKAGQVSAFFSCPGDDPRYFATYVGDWTSPVTLEVTKGKEGTSAILKRKSVETDYLTQVKWNSKASFAPEKLADAQLEVLKAEYGAGSKWLDVTNKLRDAVKNNRLEFRVDSNIGPDPNPGVGKVVRITYDLGGTVQVREAKENDFLSISATELANRQVLTPAEGESVLSFTASYSKSSAAVATPNPSEVFAESRKFWPSYWKEGGFIDLSASSDPRWKELERRVILSQYLMKVNTAGSLPPQESGLQNNGWYGRFHFEMFWWHGAHWSAWGRSKEQSQYFDIYRTQLHKAKELAAKQGFKGARWPKCIGPNGIEWPHEIHALLAWQQPHPIYFAEMEYRERPTPATLKKWWPIVEATADFMASNVFLNDKTGRYDLGPPVHVVSENTDPLKTRNPAFELGYWRFGLRVAQQWRARMGQSPNATWSKVRKNLAPLPVKEGVYVLHEDIEDMWTRFNFEHPALIGTYGMLPGDGVDKETIRRTLKKVHGTWQFNRVWGWDFPMLAMCAARLGETDLAMDFLLHRSENFQFDELGLATGGPFPYFPSNGGLLFAVAMMTAGWDGDQGQVAPGFSKPKWKVRAEGLNRVL